jgi:hypothetical protein
MHDHASHELHVRLRPWRQLCRCERRQSPARRSRRSRLNHYRRRRISLLRARSRGVEIWWSARRKEQHPQHSKCSCRPELALAGKTIEPPVRTIAKHSHLDAMKAWHRILTFSKNGRGKRGFHFAALLPSTLARKSTISRFTSVGSSCWVQCPTPGSRTLFQRFGTLFSRLST